MSRYSTALYFDVPEEKNPIIYHKQYNISFLGLEKLHPFDVGKAGRIVKILTEEYCQLEEKDIINPNESSTEDLQVVHTNEYLESLKTSYNVARITEIPFVAMVPNFFLQSKLLTPLRYQTGGTVLAAKLAMERNWSINVGGGFHHCSSGKGGGFCAYADITLAIKILKKEYEKVKKVMIVDLDAHQGNGHERDFLGDNNIYIMDVYNASIYPGDTLAKGAISKMVELSSYTKDKKYLSLVARCLEDALHEFPPDFILYNAGTDILAGDPLGLLSISAEGVIKRDEIVFEAARKRNIPIAMVMSGGYQRETARVIADSIRNLKQKGVIGFTAEKR